MASKPTPLRPDTELNLDTYDYERPQGEFAVTYHGRRIVMRDPMTLTLGQAKIVEENNLAVFRFVLEDGDLEFFSENEPNLMQMKAITEQYMAHFGFDPGKAVNSPF